MASQKVAIHSQVKVGHITGLSTEVDLIFLIDGTGSMQNLLDEVKERALSMYEDIINGLKKNNRKVTKMRIMAIVFRDVYVDKDAFEESEIFLLPSQAEDFRRFIEGIQACGGGDEPESGLEALRIAINRIKRFGQKQGKARQIVVVLTDASAHRLDDPQRAGDPLYPEEVKDCHSLEELQNFWAGLDPHYRRLTIMAPNAYPWTAISQWQPSMYVPSEAGKGIDKEGFEAVIRMISGSIS